MELYKRNARQSISWYTFLEASEALLIGSRDERVGAKLRPVTSDTGPGRLYILGRLRIFDDVAAIPPDTDSHAAPPRTWH